jgi:hypothetical protein
MSASEPPELPQEPSEVVYRRQAWVEPPVDVVPGIVPVELILARTPQRAIGLTGIRAYPTGFGCTLHLRLRKDIPGEQSNFGVFNMFGDGSIRPVSSPTTTCVSGSGSPTAARPPTSSSAITSTRARRRTRRRCGWSAGRAMTGWPGRWTCGSMACPRRGRWPSWSSGQPAASPSPGSRSTPDWSWRLRGGPHRSGLTRPGDELLQPASASAPD